MQEINFDEVVGELIARDPRYTRDAYDFTRDALDFTQKLISRDKGRGMRHVTGQELLEGIRQYALGQYGPMAITLLNEWGIRKCQDFGEVVFNMVESGLLAKTDKDTREDFKQGYDFTDAFRKPFWPTEKLKKTGAATVP
jgi:uncharacterized repeat protein (TIGR04138 family)